MAKKRQSAGLSGGILHTIYQWAWALALVSTASIIGWVSVSGLGSQWYKTVQQAVDDYSLRHGLVVQSITIEGASSYNIDDIRALIPVHEGEPLLRVSLAAIKAQLESKEWIYQASVRRRYPDTIAVHVVERAPIAIWQHQGSLHLIDQQGEVFVPRHFNPFAEYRVIIGDDAPPRTPALLALIAEPASLGERVRSASWVSNRRWDLTLDDKSVIKLPEKEMDKAWKTCADLYEKRRDLQQARHEIDMRVPGKIYIKKSE